FIDKEGNYEVEVPAAGDASWTIRFTPTSRYQPWSIQQISGKPKAGTNVINAVDQILFRDPGPKGYSSNMAQLLQYEFLFYSYTDYAGLDEAWQSTYRKRIEAIRNTLQRMPRVDRPAAGFFPDGLTQDQQRALLDKRGQVFRLYGAPLPEGGPPFGVVCE